jgi:hypothetical protein
MRRGAGLPALEGRGRHAGRATHAPSAAVRDDRSASLALLAARAPALQPQTLLLLGKKWPGLDFLKVPGPENHLVHLKTSSGSHCKLQRGTQASQVILMIRRV